MSAQYVVPDEMLHTAITEYWNAERKKEHGMRAALAAVLPLAMAQERERCIAIAQAEHGDAAQDIDMATRGCDETGRLQSEGAAHAAARIAAAIRQEPGHE